jgi:hypothetical protein
MFTIGDRVRVTGGFDQDPDWLEGKDGYTGSITLVEGDHAIVELDEVMELEWRGKNGGFEDFGEGSFRKRGLEPRPRGQWLALMHGWAGQDWREPIGRLHVGLCASPPNFKKMPFGGGIGVWVESHATMILVSE